MKFEERHFLRIPANEEKEGLLLNGLMHGEHHLRAQDRDRKHILYC